MSKTLADAFRSRLLALSVLALIYLAWRLPAVISAPMTINDEVLFSMPTVQRMLAGETLWYVAGTNYGAPVHEALAAPLMRVFGESTLILRLPPLVIGL